MSNRKEPGSGKKKQRTLLFGPGAVRHKLVDKQNRIHYVPVTEEVIEIITKKRRNVDSVENQCRRCGRTFSNEQGLGGHMIQ